MTPDMASDAKFWRDLAVQAANGLAMGGKAAIAFIAASYGIELYDRRRAAKASAAADSDTGGARV